MLEFLLFPILFWLVSMGNDVELIAKRIKKASKRKAIAVTRRKLRLR
jgi:hypothetical protein